MKTVLLLNLREKTAVLPKLFLENVMLVSSGAVKLEHRETTIASPNFRNAQYHHIVSTRTIKNINSSNERAIVY